MNRFLSLLFPPSCWHCDEPLESQQLLCKSCSPFLDILPIEEKDLIATFEGQGPARALVNALKSGKAPKIADGLAGYMALQYLQSNLPLPDLIVPVPQSLYRSFQVGYNPSLLLAKQIGKTVQRPVVNLLKRKRQWVRQLKVDKERRYQLSAANFAWKRKIPIEGKTILLVDDIIGTGATLRCCAQRLNEGFPLKIIKMALLREQMMMSRELVP